MFYRALLFPQSPYLQSNWWHRLLKVLLPFWAVFIVFGTLLKNAKDLYERPSEFLFVIPVIYVALIAPSLLYRGALYVFKSTGWQDAA